MPATGQQTTWRSRAGVAFPLALLLLSAGCSTSGTPAPDTQHGYSGSSSLTDLFAGSTAKGAQTVAGAQPDVNCPGVEVRRGAATLIMPPGEQSAMTVKYQGSFVRAARDCSLADGNMIVKVGVEGRIIIGPAGAPGQIAVPLRFAVVQETTGGIRTITTKFVSVPVTVNADGALFTHVEDALVFPLPTPTAVLDDYVIYIGFDPVSGEAQAKPPPKTRPRPKAKPATSAN